MVKRLHHLNFIVRDLAATAPQFAALMGVEEWQPELLPDRGVKLARFNVGGIWIILVQPTDPRCPPWQQLEEHGEGFFLASFEVEDLERTVKRLEEVGIAAGEGPPRKGLDGWQLQDLDPNAFNGICLQLVEPRP